MSDKVSAPSRIVAPHDSAVPLIGGIFDAAMTARNWRAFVNRLSDVLLDHGILLLLQKVGREVFRAQSPETFEPLHDKPQERIRLRIDLSRSVDADALQMTSEDGDVDAWRPIKSALEDEAEESQAPTYVLGCFVSKQDSAACLMGVRWRDDTVSNDESLAFLRSFVPELQRAFTLHKQFTRLRTQHHAASDVLNWLPFGVLFVDAQGNVLTKNRKAQAMCAENDGLTIERSVLVADSAQETTHLRELILHAAVSARDQVVTEAMTVARPSMRRPFTVMVSSLTSSERSEASGAPAAVVFVSDPEENYNIAEETVLHFFDLTPAEARLLVALANGSSLSEVSASHQVTVNTLKTQLNHIFRKTGTNRQSDLIKLVFSTPVVMNAFASEKRGEDKSQKSSD